EWQSSPGRCPPRWARREVERRRQRAWPAIRTGTRIRKARDRRRYLRTVPSRRPAHRVVVAPPQHRRLDARIIGDRIARDALAVQVVDLHAAVGEEPEGFVGRELGAAQDVPDEVVEPVERL